MTFLSRVYHRGFYGLLYVMSAMFIVIAIMALPCLITICGFLTVVTYVGKAGRGLSVFPFSTSAHSLRKLEFHALHQLFGDSIAFIVLTCRLSVEVSSNIISVEAHSIGFPLETPNNTILLVHGANSGPLFWTQIVPTLLHHGYGVHCVSLPGFGESTVSMEALTTLSSEELLEFYVEFLRHYIQQYFPHTKPVLVGHSFGGYLVSTFICKYGKLCTCAQLFNSAGLFPIFGSHTVFWGAMFWVGFPNRFVRKLGVLFNIVVAFTIYVLDYPDKVGYWNMAQMSCRENQADRLISKFINFTGFTSHWKCTSFVGMITSDQLPPIHFIWGEDDTIIPKEIALFCMEFVKDAKRALKIIPRCCHSPSTAEHHRQLGSAILEGIHDACELRTCRELKRNLIGSFTADSCPVTTLRDREKLFATIRSVHTQEQVCAQYNGDEQ